MKPRVVASRSGSSSRKASWPRSVSTSTNETLAPPRVEGAHQSAAIAGREQPIRRERDDAKPRLRTLERFGQRAAVIGGEVEIIHRPRHVEIGVRVEPLDENLALMAQIGFHLEIGVERESALRAVLQIAAELFMQRAVGEIGDVRGHARHRQAFGRAHAFREIAPGAPVRVGHDRLPADFVERDVLRGVAHGGGDRQRREHAVLIGGGPLQHLHAAHRAAGHAEQAVDAERVDQHGLRPHHVGDGDDRQRQRIGLAASPDRSKPVRWCPCSRPAHWRR